VGGEESLNDIVGLDDAGGAREVSEPAQNEVFVDGEEDVFGWGNVDRQQRREGLLEGSNNVELIQLDADDSTCAQTQDYLSSTLQDNQPYNFGKFLLTP
jgi:hypothetical protein